MAEEPAPRSTTPALPSLTVADVKEAVQARDYRILELELFIIQQGNAIEQRDAVITELQAALTAAQT